MCTIFIFSISQWTFLISIRSYAVNDFHRWKDLQWAVNFHQMEHFWWQEVQMAKCFSTTITLLGLFALCLHIKKLVWVQHFTQSCHRSLQHVIGLEKSRSGNSKQSCFSGCLLFAKGVGYKTWYAMWNFVMMCCMQERLLSFLLWSLSVCFHNTVKMVLWLAAEQRSGLTLSLGPGDKFLPLLCQSSGAHLVPLWYE